MIVNKQISCGDALTLSPVVAGCMRALDAHIHEDDFLQFVKGCLALGVDTFDHAPVYGGYGCEQFFGDAVLRREPALRSKMKLITKAGIVLPGTQGNKTIYYKSTKDEIARELDASLAKLGTDHVDLLLIHRPDILGDPAETADALESVVKAGKALHVGVSNYTPAQMSALQSYLSIPLVTNQVELSAKETGHFTDGTVDDAFQRRIPLMAWSPLGGGSIFHGTGEQAVRLRTCLTEIAAAHNVSLDVILYAWLFTHPVRIMAITGTMNLERVKLAAQATALTLSYDEWYQILEASRGYAVP